WNSSRNDPGPGPDGGVVAAARTADTFGRESRREQLATNGRTFAMRRTWIGLGAAMALAAGPADAQNSVKIGFVDTFSGPTAVIGNDMRDAFELALDHLAHKMAGHPVQVIYEDDQQKPEVGRQKTDKLIASDHVNFITGYIWSNVLLASLKPAVDSKTFII